MSKMAPRAENLIVQAPKSSSDHHAEDSLVPGTIQTPERGSVVDDDDSSSVHSVSSYTTSSSSVGDDYYYREEYFDSNRFLDFSRELGYITFVWNIVLGLSATMDFLAATVDSHMRTYFTWETERFDPWLRRNSFELGMIFSFLWFIDSFITATEMRNHTLKEIEKARLLQEEGWEKRTKHAKWKATRDFLVAMAIQLLLLPIGFYIWITPGDTFTLTVAGRDDALDMNQTETFRTTSNVSLGYALLRYASKQCSELLKKEAVQHGKKRAYKWLRGQVRHPVQLVRTISKVTKWIRWVRIIGPVIGTSNKLLGNSVDLYKKFKQRRETAKAAKIRRTLWLHMTDEEAKEHAAILAQKMFRAKRARKEMRALHLIQGNRARLAAISLQKRFRAALKRARKRIKRKKRELEKLEMKAKKVKQDLMSDSERIRMHKLQAELAEDADRFINRNLLRPNTTFSVVWRTTFVLSVILELSTLILHISFPALKKENLFPVPYYARKECRRGVAIGFGKILSIFDRSEPAPLPRYCQDDMVALQAFGVGLMRLLVEGVLLTVNFMFFFDVPVSFFTGQFNPNNGVLEPKPFFPRWIAPGVLLQMIVNPQMDTIAELIATAVTKIQDLGPIRVFRWIVAVFFPIFLYLADVSPRLWAKFVSLQNSVDWRKSKTKPKASLAGEKASSGKTKSTSTGYSVAVGRTDPRNLHARMCESSASY
uniref:Uncharacterized protein n=1 Tax=Amphora coffeiformis TaxID=265554 RepID=A0A7S3L5Y3_9STRA